MLSILNARFVPTLQVVTSELCGKSEVGGPQALAAGRAIYCGEASLLPREIVR